MEARDNPDTRSRLFIKEPEHRTNEVLVLRLHPVAVCADDPGVAVFVFLGEGCGEVAPFVGFD